MLDDYHSKGAMNTHAPYPGLGTGATWQEHHTPDGRTYYYNATTQKTQWTKPEDVMTPAERALANQPWKEYTAEGGKKYWYNTDTKTSSWEMPEAYKRALGVPETPATPATPGSFPTPGGIGDRGYDRYRDRDSYRDRDNYRDRDQRDVIGESRQLTFGNDLRAQQFVSAAEEPEFATPEEAEAAFVKLLRRSGIQPDWNWEQTLRAIVKDPQYRAIRDPRERKLAFEKYCHDVIAQDQEKARERLTKLRADFTTMLKSHPEIMHYTKWKTARPMIEGETIFRSTNNDGERRLLFEDYIADLKKVHREQQTSLRKSAMDGLINLLPKLNLEVYTRWSEAQEIISGTQPFQIDEKYKSLTKFDILTVFQNHMKAVERTFNDTRQAEKAQKHRTERQNRDELLHLLQELKRDGKIKAGTKWNQTFSLVENDPRYTAMLGQSGSTPQELFWDMVEEEERGLRGTRNDVTDVIYDKGLEITPNTDFRAFLAVMKEDRRTANVDSDILKFMLERLQERKVKPEDDRQTERPQRRAVDDLRAYMKRLDPPITLSDTYEKVKARIQNAHEFQAVVAEDARRGAFERQQRRLRDREEEAEKEKERLRRRDRSRDRYRERDREREREKDRGERSHRRGHTRSRSPEPDLYEADRRKAIAERERNYRKTSMAETLLSDRRLSVGHDDRDHRERDRGDRDRLRDRERDRSDRERDRVRDRDYDRPPRSRREEVPPPYERERRDREEERERVYRRRVVDRDVEGLNYGDEKPSLPRRRRAEDDAIRRPDSRDSKRLKIENSPRERTPRREGHLSNVSAQPSAKEKEDLAGVHSGSEEGEIEED